MKGEITGENTKIKVGASVLSADFSNLKDEIRLAEQIGSDYIHWDIMDGHFVPNISFGPMVPEALKDKTELPFSAHLMIENPEKFIPELSEAGIDLCVLQYETCKNVSESIEEIRKLGMKPGIALKPETQIDKIKGFFENLDMVMIMTVEPGYGGQELMRDKLSKIRKTRKIVRNRGINIEVGIDGGVHRETVESVIDAGANSLVMGSAIYEKDVEITPKEIKEKYKIE